MENNRKTIKERAKLASGGDDDNYLIGIYEGYIKGATEQKEIDREEMKQLRSIMEHTASVQELEQSGLMKMQDAMQY